MLRLINRSLRSKITISVVVPLILILGTFTTIEYARHEEAVLYNLSFLAAQTAQVIENSLQHEMLSRNLQGIQEMLDAIGESQEMSVVFLMDTNGQVIFAPEGIGKGVQLDNRDPTCQPCHRLPPIERPSSVVVTLPDGARVFRSMNPIENLPACQECHEPAQRLIGLLLTDISMASIEAPLAADLQAKFLWGTMTILVTIVVVNLVMSRLVLQRLERLAQTIAQFGHGQRELRLPTRDSDEIGQLTRAFNDMGQRIEIEATENLALTEQLRHQSEQRGALLKRLITAQEDERKRVARELHDDLGQALAGLALQAEATEKYIGSNPDRALSQLRQIKQLVNETIKRMYDLIMALRPSALDDLGLAAALNSRAQNILVGTGINFKLETEELTERLPSEIEITVYRIFLEALTNIIRHANANQVRITLTQRNSTFMGEITDDGSGFDPQSLRASRDSPGGYGLLSMHERVTQYGGHIEIASKPGEGTCIQVRIPITGTE